MGEYLKMRHTFCGKIVRKIGFNSLYEGGVKIGEFTSPRKAEYAAHAIKYHDSLVAENDELRQQVELLKGLISNMQ